MAPPTESPGILSYAEPLPQLSPLRRGLRMAIVVLAAVTVLVLLRGRFEHYRAQWKHRQAVKAMLSVQSRALHYHPPAGRVLFDPATGVAFHPPVYDQLVQSLGPSFDRDSLGFDIGGAVLWMHEVVSPEGRRVLMIVNLHEPSTDSTTYMLRCYQVDLGTDAKPAQISRISCPLAIRTLPLAAVRGFAGRATPGDRSGFTVPLSINGQRVDVRCGFQNDRTVRFETHDAVLLDAGTPREGAVLYVGRLPTPDEVLKTRYTWSGVPNLARGVDRRPHLP